MDHEVASKYQAALKRYSRICAKGFFEELLMTGERRNQIIILPKPEWRILLRKHFHRAYKKFSDKYDTMSAQTYLPAWEKMLFFTVLNREFISRFVWDICMFTGPCREFEDLEEYDTEIRKNVIVFLPEIQQFLKMGKVLPRPTRRDFLGTDSYRHPDGIQKHLEAVEQFARQARKSAVIRKQRWQWYTESSK